MRYEKSAYYPPKKLRKERIDLSDPASWENVRVLPYHMRVAKEGLVCGEGFVEVGSVTVATRVFAAGGKLFSYNAATGDLYDFYEKVRFNVKDLADVCVGYGESGYMRLFFLGEQEVHYSEGGSTVRLLSQRTGGCAAAMHRERLFFVNGSRVCYTAALGLEAENGERSPDGYGYADFTSADGDFVGIAPYRDRLYLFRERGVLELRADGEALNFSAAVLPYACGTVVKGSVARCGDKLVFLTDQGLYYYDGSFHRAENAYTDEFTPVEPAQACACGNIYYTIVDHAGERKVYAYDFFAGYGRYILAEQLLSISAWGGSLYLLAGGRIIVLTEKGGAPFGGAHNTVTLVFSPKRSERLVSFCLYGTSYKYAVQMGKSYSGVVPQRRIYVGSACKDARSFTVEMSDREDVLEAVELEWRDLNDD